MTGVSQRAFARLRGVAMSAVQKAIASKRITPNADGTIDPERADQEWARNTFAGQALHQATPPEGGAAPCAPRGTGAGDDPRAASIVRSVIVPSKPRQPPRPNPGRGGRTGVCRFPPDLA